VGFRYCGLAALQLRPINHKRACTLVAAHAAGRPMPGTFPTAHQHCLLTLWFDLFLACWWPRTPQAPAAPCQTRLQLTRLSTS